MDTPPGGEMVEGKLWDYEFSVNENQVSDNFDFGIGIGEPDVTDFCGYSNGFEDQFQFDHQSQTSFNFSSLLQGFQTDNAFAECQENLVNQQSDMVQNHVVSCEKGDVMMEELAPNSSMVHDHGLSSEEKAMLEFTQTLEEWEMMMDELAPNSSMVHDHVLTSDEAMLQFMSTPNVVHDHLISSTEGNMMMMEEVLPAFTLHGHALSHEKEDFVDNVKQILNVSRPNLTYCNGSKLRVRWTPGLHAWFVKAVKELGGCETATPKRILSLMDIPGLTRFQIKSHLQKYRNGGCWLVDGIDRSEAEVNRASISQTRNSASNSSSSYISPVPQGPSDSPSSSRITKHGKSKGKGKGKYKGKAKRP
ncbi:protein PHOSPHATE STARVATION RESPONSE 1-like isoform X2 [Euphorbia lathyris]|uniref:protein PHOSPHATE STARVATION RESPONSE 1-like isoform X2 n=1 Tax=Euphorbia lathyris TaxID=212925 RepID=UPI00331359FA